MLWCPEPPRDAVGAGRSLGGGNDGHCCTDFILTALWGGDDDSLGLE